MGSKTDEVHLDENSGGVSGGRGKGETNADEEPEEESEEDPFSYRPRDAYKTRRGDSYP